MRTLSDDAYCVLRESTDDDEDEDGSNVSWPDFLSVDLRPSYSVEYANLK